MMTIDSFCVRRYACQHDELVDDQVFVRWPHRIGRSYLLYGRKRSHFPYQMFVGSDWPCMCITYLLMIVPTIFFINNVAIQYGPGVIVAVLILLIITLSFYSFTACSDPGIIWIEKTDNDDQGKVEDVERAMNKLECGICHIDRPRTASHCFECGMCVDKLDHHCPWTGKCIGKKTINTFYAFLVSLTILIAFVVITVLATAILKKPVFSLRPKF